MTLTYRSRLVTIIGACAISLGLAMAGATVWAQASGEQFSQHEKDALRCVSLWLVFAGQSESDGDARLAGAFRNQAAKTALSESVVGPDLVFSDEQSTYMTDFAVEVSLSKRDVVEAFAQSCISRFVFMY